MVTPHRTPWTRKCAFDVSDYGLGYCANSLGLVRGRRAGQQPCCGICVRAVSFICACLSRARASATACSLLVGIQHASSNAVYPVLIVHLHQGCDCLGSIYYFDATLSDSKGRPKVLPRAVCMHEEDVGLLWKHVEYR